MQVHGINWHALTLGPRQFDLTRQSLVDLGMTPVSEMTDFARFVLPDGGLLELYGPEAAPLYGFNGDVAFGFTVHDIEAASAEFEAAGFELLSDIIRLPELGVVFRHVRGPAGIVYGLNQPIAGNDPGGAAPVATQDLTYSDAPSMLSAFAFEAPARG